RYRKSRTPRGGGRPSSLTADGLSGNLKLELDRGHFVIEARARQRSMAEVRSAAYSMAAPLIGYGLLLTS
ncbi:hypothetical protein HaLaN_03265, partial [Haematococcus lacustris]